MKYTLFILILTLFIQLAHAQEVTNLKIVKIRVIGSYPSPNLENTLELWFSTPIPWGSGSKCIDTRRVYVDAKQKHIVAAAYLAVASKKLVNIYAASNLPIRNGVCEIAYLDIISP